MKKLYVTVTDEVYDLLENYVSFYSASVIGISKSSVVNSLLYSFLAKTSVFKDEIDFVPSVEVKK